MRRKRAAARGRTIFRRSAPAEYASEGARYLLSGNAEITMEVNPATVDYDSLVRYRRAGINRLSIGVQSFQDEELKFLGRIHTAGEAECCFTMARRAGFENINIDLIFGIPGSTADSWKSTLRRAVALRPDHLSFYSLQIEEGTPLYRMFRLDDIQQVSDEENRRMYHDAVQFLEQAGYHQYEISNAALAKRECRHNLKYWSYAEYLGLGLGASSFVGGSRFKNTSRMHEYLTAIRKHVPPVDQESIENYSQREEMGIFVFTGLRKAEGFSLDHFHHVFRKDFFDVYDEDILKKYKGLLICADGRLYLSEHGMDVSNRIMAEFV